MKIILVTLTKITFQQNDALHTIAYARDIPNWLSKWSLEHNFTPICTTAETEETNLSPPDQHLLVSASKSKLVNQFITMLKNGFREHTKAERDYAADFRFTFEVFGAESGEPMKLLSF